MKTCRVAALALSCSLFALSAPARAQAVATAADEAATVGAEEIIVTAQQNNQTQVIRSGDLGALGDKPAEDVPFSIKSYNAALILNQQPNTLGDVLQNDPAIRVTYGFGNAAELFVIRGFPVFGDDVGFNSLYGITPRQLVAPELYDQVQVLNGASAFLNGAAPGGSAIGGNINLAAKRAGDDDLNRVTANYTSDAHVGGSVDVARRFGEGGRFGVRINGAARRGDVAIDDEFRSAYVIGGGFDFRGESVRLSLDLAYQRFKVNSLRPKVTIGTATIPRVPRASHNYAQPWAYTTLRDIFGTARAEWDVADNAMLYAVIGARDGSEKGVYQGLTVTNAVTGAATGNALFVPRTDNNEAATAGARVKLAAGGITQEFNAGASLTWQVNRNAFDFLYGPGFAGFQTNIYDTPDVPLPSSTFQGGNLDDPFPISRTRLRSVFASDTIGLWEDRILLTAGIRLQEIKTTSYSYFDGSAAPSYEKSSLTPVVGLVVKPVAGVSLFANRIEGLQQGPTAPASGFNAITGTTQPVSNLGQVFAPFRSTQYEAGAKATFGRFNASVAVYQIKLPLGQVTPDPAAPGFLRFGLFGEQRNRGVELSVDGELTKGLRVIAGGAFVKAKLRDTPFGANDGNYAPGVPKYTGNANVEWDTPFVPGLTLTGRVIYTGKQKVDQANTLQIKGWTRFDLGARFVLVAGDKPITLRAGVENVANKRYWASAFDSFNQALLQGAPRTAKLSASIDF
ncbi:TonB-dependent receptor [Sphingomonas profundi]|uniref:TonB-dependent receptor n=1 Tax=Alterirhizorhabdus profundi TaxID=2681549 RepID=UPI0012E843EE|nr:TonB-dependent receptor [Sphingomonas profundi]